MAEQPQSEASLRHKLDVLQREHTSIVGSIHELRQRAREKSIQAADTRTPLPQADIDFWQAKIKASQLELMQIQERIGAVNRSIRASRASTNDRVASERRRQKERSESETLYLSCFRQIAQSTLDPRLYAAIERDAKQLAADHAAMHKEHAP
jgi:hypothetical protein